MREIKYQVWYPLDYKMYEVKELELNSGMWRAKVVGVTNKLGFYVSNLTGSLREYIGLKDKYDRDIYTGDVLKCSFDGQEFIREVKFMDGHFGVDDGSGDIWTIPEDCVVLGNVYENEELSK